MVIHQNDPMKKEHLIVQITLVDKVLFDTKKGKNGVTDTQWI